MNKSEQKVYIVIVNFNRAHDTIDCIKSIRDGEYENYAIVLLDNCSNENDVCILEDFIRTESVLAGQIVFIKNDSNIGFAAANNIGIKYAIEKSIDCILLLNNDTVVHRDFLPWVIDAAKSERTVGMVTGKIIDFYSRRIWYGGGYIDTKRGTTYHRDLNKKNIEDTKRRIVTFASGCFMLVKKEVFLSVGFMDEDYFLYFEDADFCYRLIQHGYTIIYEPRSIIYHKINSSTGTLSKIAIYYWHRNRPLFVKKNINGSLNKLLFWIFFIFTRPPFLVKNFSNAKYMLVGIIDFILCKTGYKKL